MKKWMIILSLGVFLAGCSSQQVGSSPTTATEKKAPNTTLRGTITKVGQKYVIASPGKPTTELDSYTVKLDLFVDKTVSVTGQYSGTTLFVDTVQQ